MRFHYSGDVNIEHGGMFYNLDTFHWDFADAVRVTPCTDAGAADNCYWVEILTINIPTQPAKVNGALATIGLDEDYLKDLTPSQRRHLMVQCAESNGLCDVDTSAVVSIGPYTYGEKIKVDRVLRGNTSLSRYARRVAKEGFP